MFIIEGHHVAALLQLTKLMEDATPEACVMTLLGYMSWIHDGYGTMLEDPQLGAIHPHMLRFRTAVLHWLSAPCSSSEMDALVNETCRCGKIDQPEDASAHEEGHEMLLSLGYRLAFFVLFNLLTRVLQVSFKNKSASAVGVKLHHLEGRSAWPSGLQDLLPHGPEGTMRGLLSWYKHGISGTSTIRLHDTLLGILSFTSTLTFPFVVTSTVLVPYGVIQELDSACDRIEDLPGAPPKPEEVSKLGVLELIASCCHLIMRLSFIYGDEPLRLALTRPFTAELVRVLVRVIMLLSPISRAQGTPEACGPRFLEVSETTMEVLHQLLQDFIDLRQPSRLSPDLEILLSGEPRFPPWKRLIQAVDQLNKMRRCAAVGCTNTFSGQRLLKRCGRCCRVVYCSRRCQKAAWAHPVAPHRTVCEPLRRVCWMYKLGKRGLLGLAQHEPVIFDEDLACFVVEALPARRDMGWPHYVSAMTAPKTGKDLLTYLP
jgi:hypothetical protein